MHFSSRVVSTCAFFIVTTSSFADQSPEVVDAQNADTEHIEVAGLRQRLVSSGALKAEDIAKTELIDSDAIKKSQSASLVDAIQNAIGIRVSNDCSMCGAKRIMINGLKGEHTNILIDGIPMHTMLSGFYGMDSMAVSGIGSIEIARGAGASLTAPEAIGGTVNLVTKYSDHNSLELDISAGTDSYRKVSLVGTAVSYDGNTKATLIAQNDNRDQYDGDGNGVSENPQLSNQSATIYLSHDIGYRNNIRFRYSNVSSEVFGGPVLGDAAQSISDALTSVSLGEAEQLFQNGDVRNRFIGNPWETAEWVKTKRDELSGSWLHDINGRMNVTSSLAYVQHEQDSFYEGVDYFADDTMYHLSTKFNWDFNDTHFLVFGLDYRNEEMRSASQALASNPNYVSDSFDYQVTGLFIEDSWTPTENLELAIAFRLDNIRADFVDPAKPGVEIDDYLLSPRFDMKYSHSDALTSRISFGQGYRAPLSFFESDHGILDAGKGFKVEVTEPERSLGTSYSLNYLDEKLSSTFSIAYTEVDHLATLVHDDFGTPVLAQLDKVATVLATDLSISYQFFENADVSFIAEQFDYNDTFKSSYAIIPVEQRISLATDIHYQGWEVTMFASWVGARELTDYGYEGYNDVNASVAKETSVGSYITVDLKLSKQISSGLSLYVGAQNLTNYTQVEEGESPLMFDAEGGYDVVYIYGPLRGRTVYAGLTYEL